MLKPIGGPWGAPGNGIARGIWPGINGAGGGGGGGAPPHGLQKLPKEGGGGGGGGIGEHGFGNGPGIGAPNDGGGAPQRGKPPQNGLNGGGMHWFICDFDFDFLAPIMFCFF